MSLSCQVCGRPADPFECPKCHESPMDVSCACCGHGYPAKAELQALEAKLVEAEAKLTECEAMRDALDKQATALADANLGHQMKLVERQAEIDWQVSIGAQLAADVAKLKAVMRTCINNCDCDEPCANCLRVEAALAEEAS